jgi:hypothetical protein
MKASGMFVIEALFAADKDFPEWPITLVGGRNNIATRFIFGDVAVVELS